MNNMAAMHGSGNGQAVGTPSNISVSNDNDQHRRKLNTYIYDYFLRNGQFKLAKAFLGEVEIDTVDKPSPDRKNVNGAADDNDSKDDIPGRPADLPRPNVPSEVNSAFLFDWWCQFWDCWQAARSKNSSPTKQYLQHVQNQRMAMDRQRMVVNPQIQAMNARAGMMPNGMVMNPEIKKAMMMQGARPANPAQLQQQLQMQRQAAAMSQQNQMQREGSRMDPDGQQRPQTPGVGDAPSPKRQRLEGNSFNGQVGPAGRGQVPGVPGQMPNAQQKSNVQQYSSGLRQQMQSAMDGKNQDNMHLANGVNQGSPAMNGNTEFIDSNGMRSMGPAGPANGTGAHALQDYQMQLMLLEQQNKKRLLMARQEQEGQGGSGPMNGQNGNANGGFSAPAMSPSNSRTGPSPNPDEQMKRGTPKMIPTGIPQQAMDMGMQGRASPAPGFDPNQMNPGMVPGFQQGMKMHPSMMGPNGQLMGGHAAFNPQMNGQITQQQMEMMRMQAANKPGGWAQGPHPGMMHPGQAQQAPNMTPQQRNSNMPPPPAPAADAQARTQPPSPQQNPAPPTPSQANKPNPKKKEGAKQNKKAANKKGGVAATPVSEAGEQPPTPTPAPPITPTAPPQQFKNQPQVPGPQPQLGQTGGLGDPNVPLDMAAGPFGGGLDDMDMSFNMEFGTLGTDNVLALDFDTFLHNDEGADAFNFDGAMNFDGGLEAGGDL